MQISKQHIEIAHNFYQAQDAMKFLHGDKYDSKVAETSEVIKQVAEAHECDTFSATEICVRRIVEKIPFDNGLEAYRPDPINRLRHRTPIGYGLP